MQDTFSGQTIYLIVTVGGTYSYRSADVTALCQQ